MKTTKRWATVSDTTQRVLEPLRDMLDASYEVPSDMPQRPTCTPRETLKNAYVRRMHWCLSVERTDDPWWHV